VPETTDDSIGRYQIWQRLQISQTRIAPTNQGRYPDFFEYASSGSLFDILEGNGRNEVELRVRIKWALDIAQGLHKMSTQGLVHGDIKPRNVVITNLKVAKLIDFAGKGYTTGYHC
jgi:serine/threonine protein kinase